MWAPSSGAAELSGAPPFVNGCMTNGYVTNGCMVYCSPGAGAAGAPSPGAAVCAAPREERRLEGAAAKGVAAREMCTCAGKEEEEKRPCMLPLNFHVNNGLRPPK